MYIEHRFFQSNFMTKTQFRFICHLNKISRVTNCSLNYFPQFQLVDKSSLPLPEILDLSGNDHS